MTILLDTGSLTNPLAPQVTVAGVTVDNTPSERVVYPHTKEQLLVVKPGEMIVLTSYGLDTNKAEVKKILLSNGVPELGTGGCNPVITSAQSAVLNRVTIPAYTMCSDAPVTILDIPGVYSVAPTADLNGAITITAVSHQLQHKGPRFSEIQNIDFGV